MSFFGPPAAGVDDASTQKQIKSYLAEINKQKKAVLNLQKRNHACDEKERTNATRLADAKAHLAQFEKDWDSVKNTPKYKKKKEKLDAEIAKLTIEEMNLSVDCGILRRQLSLAESLQEGMENGLEKFKKKYNVKSADDESDESDDEM
jgi:hypothetical protein